MVEGHWGTGMQRTWGLLALMACAPDATAPPSADTARLEPEPPRPEAFSDPQLSAEALRPHLEALQAIAEANDGHRSVGSPGYAASVDYVVSVAEGLGLTPTREDVPYRSWRATGPSTLTTDTEGWSSDAGELAAFVNAPGGSVTGTIAPVDVTIPPSSTANSSTSGCESEDFSAFPKGSIALIQRGTCTFTQKAQLAEAAGAIGVLIFNEGQPGRTDVVAGTMDPESDLSIPVLGLSYDLGADLTKTLTPVTLDHAAEQLDITTQNVLVTLDGQRSDRVLLGAHLDSVPAGPGLNDNGTGVAVMLQVMTMLANQPERAMEVTLGFWGAEEVGLVGSLHHASQMSDDDILRTIAHINIDMGGSPNPVRFVFDGDESDYAAPPSLNLPEGSAWLESTLLDHFVRRDEPTAPVRFEGRTDYVGFAQVGIPVAGIFTGAEKRMTEDEALTFAGTAGLAYDPCYHQACDALENVDLEMLASVAQGTGAVLTEILDQEGPLPRAAGRLPLTPPALRARWSPHTCDASTVVVR